MPVNITCPDDFFLLWVKPLRTVANVSRKQKDLVFLISKLGERCTFRKKTSVGSGRKIICIFKRQTAIRVYCVNKISFALYLPSGF